MFLFGKHVNDLQSGDILRLIENEIGESDSLDYKMLFNIDEDKDKNRQEFFCDISAIHNTNGGCLIYGLEEKKDAKGKNTGIPLKVVDNPVENKESLQLKILDTVRSNTDPNIVGLAVKFLSINECNVIIIGISRNMGLPSMVTYNNINKYFRRSAASKY